MFVLCVSLSVNGAHIVLFFLRGIAELLCVQGDTEY